MPAPRSAEFVEALGATLDDALMARTLWWAGFKALRNGCWLDLRGEAERAAMEVRGLVRAMARYRAA